MEIKNHIINHWVQEIIHQEIYKKFLKSTEKLKYIQQNIWNTLKTVLRGKCIVRSHGLNHDLVEIY